MTIRTWTRRSLSLFLALFLSSCTLIPTIVPTALPTVPPSTATPVPTDLPTATRLPTATPTATPLPTLTPTATPLPLPTATPLPPGDDTLLRQAEAALADGDFAAAVQLYSQAQSELRGTALAGEASLGLARTYVEMGAPLSATAALGSATGAMPEDQRRRAYFWLGEAWNAAGDCQQAISFYDLFLAGETTIADLIAERQAWCYRTLGDPARAAEAFTRAAGPLRSASDQVAMLEDAAGDLRAAGDYDAALARYQSILDVAQNAWYRATILFEMGEALQEAGRPNEARARWREVLDSYPNTEAASRAADLLAPASDVPVNPYHVALAYWAAGRLAEALPWFDTALNEITPTAEMRYTVAAARAEGGDLEGALAQLDLLAQAYPSDTQPLLEQARLLGEYGAVARALEVYHGVIERFPQDAAAGEAHWRAGRLLEAQGHDSEAVAEYAALLDAFPDHVRAGAARFRAGLLHYRGGQYTAAAEVWGGEQGDGTTRAALWRGLALARLDQQEAAREAWAVAAAGQGYYAARARELLSTEEGFGAFHGWPTWGDDAQEQAAAEAWLTQRFGQPATENLPSTVREDPLFLRGEELLSLGRPEEARHPFYLLVDRYRYDGPSLYPLSLYFRRNGFYALSVSCAEKVVPTIDLRVAEAPAFFLRLLYPTPYAHLIVPEAQGQDMDPLLFFALAYQESRFDRYATSWADARGLTQVIPSTGQGIADSLGFSPFRLEDLYRPVVSVRFGTWYLGQQLRAFEGQALVALAAYNGGPGNARRWANRVIPVADLDLFVEAVDYEETRDYLERVYTAYWMYRQLYTSLPTP